MIRGTASIAMLLSFIMLYQQLREITAELADKKFLRYIEPDETYITTDKGIKFLEETKGTGKSKG
jgi:predicted transcriptional regulator